MYGCKYGRLKGLHFLTPEELIHRRVRVHGQVFLIYLCQFIVQIKNYSYGCDHIRTPGSVFADIPSDRSGPTRAPLPHGRRYTTRDAKCIGKNQKKKNQNRIEKPVVFQRGWRGKSLRAVPVQTPIENVGRPLPATENEGPAMTDKIGGRLRTPQTTAASTMAADREACYAEKPGAAPNFPGLWADVRRFEKKGKRHEKPVRNRGVKSTQKPRKQILLILHHLRRN